MSRSVYKIIVRPDWVQCFTNLQCGMYTCIHVGNNKILQLDDT